MNEKIKAFQKSSKLSEKPERSSALALVMAKCSLTLV